jgi:alpha-glucosidase
LLVTNSTLEPKKGYEWWRSSVIYQVYPRSFADGNGDGIGDLDGIKNRLPALAELGVDAVWFSPFFKSPQNDAGYDVSDYRDIDPLFGTLQDFDEMLAEAHSLGLKVIVDLVPNHSSSEHPWFQLALKSAPGSPERNRYIFKDGKGENGELPPNNWQSVFGGSAWTRITEPDGTPGQWYLHLFDSSQPDWNWENPEIIEEFNSILRFWLDRGADGFRIDVAHSMKKDLDFPDLDERNSDADGGAMTDAEVEHPFWNREGVHEINRRWRSVLDEYQDRAMCAEAWVMPLSKMAKWVRPDEYHQTFNFGYLETPWDPKALKNVVSESMEAFPGVGAPSTWVLSNHDVIRHSSRFGASSIPRQGAGIGPDDDQPDEELGLRRARASSAFMLGLPGGAYIYQGEELGLPEHTTLDHKYREDPTFFRTNGERVGRDGCRVPIPWEHDKPSFGFGPTERSWLPQPEKFAEYARDVQQGVKGSTLELYKKLLKLRKELSLGLGDFHWLEPLCTESSIAFENNGIAVVSNMGEPIDLPSGEILVSTQEGLEAGGKLGTDQTAWIRL